MAESTEDEWAEKCVLCKDYMKNTPTVIVKRKSILNMIKASKIRGDSVVKQVLLTRSSITVHSNCSKTYSSKSSLKHVDNETQYNISTRSTSDKFDFENMCIFCGKNLNRGKLKVSSVSDTSYKSRLLEKYVNSDHPEAQELVNRLLSVDCLVSVGAQYHRRCIKHPSFDKPNKTTASKPTLDSLNYVVSYILDKPDKSQFCLSDILTSNNKSFDIWPGISALKSRLQEKFQNEFIIQTSKGEVIISRMSFARLLLLQNFNNSRVNGNDDCLQTNGSSPKKLKST